MERRFLLTFTTIFLAGSALVTGALWFVYSADIKIQRVRIETKETQQVKLQRVRLATHFHGVTSDLEIIANLHELKQLADNLSDHSTEELTSDFISFSIRKRHYDQIRFINNDGTEIIRVDYNNEKPEVVPKESLQNKAHRYYFNDSMLKGDNQVYVSPLDLNVENKQVEKPFKPMIRFGTPILNSQREKKGVVILNFRASRMISDFKKIGQESPGESWILNQQGYWLASPNPHDEWGFMFDNRKHINLKTRFPEVWDNLISKVTGQFYHPNGLYTFDTFHPSKEAVSKHLFSEESHHHTRQSTEKDNWKIISFIPKNVLNAELQKHSSDLLNTLGIIFAVLVTLNGLTAFLLASSQLKRRRAEDALKQNNLDLEERIRRLEEVKR